MNSQPDISIGDALRAAREQKGQTPSQVAEATHIKVQVIEAMERNEFRKIAAPIYAKGFIKMYAEYLALDPAPLVQRFQAASAPVRSDPVVGPAPAAPSAPRTQIPPVRPRSAAPAAAAKARLPRLQQSGMSVWKSRLIRFGQELRDMLPTSDDVGGRFRSLADRGRGFPIAKVAVGAGIAIVLILCLSMLSRCGRKESAAAKSAAAPPPPPAAGTLRLVQEPPEPYMEPRSAKP